MDFMNYMVDHKHEQLVFCHDQESGLRAFIGVHSTVRGPSLGGVRLWKYQTPEDAVVDVLRLSEGMTYKSAVAGLPLGGGKAVVMADGRESEPDIRAARFRALGRFVEGLNGRYIAAEDVGTKPNDMMQIRRSTEHVAGIPPEKGGSGDPSPMTAYGVWRGIQALIEDVLDKQHADGVHVAIQGLGKVGMGLADYLLEAGATVTGTDIYPDRLAVAEEKGIQVVKPEAIYDVDCDIFSPCALGAVINDDTLPRLKCKIVAGAANNQLAEERHGQILEDKGIVYAVDYVINAGGVINVAHEVGGYYDEASARHKTTLIYDTIKRMLSIARAKGMTTTLAAHEMALEALHAPVMA